MFPYKSIFDWICFPRFEVMRLGSANKGEELTSCDANKYLTLSNVNSECYLVISQTCVTFFCACNCNVSLSSGCWLGRYSHNRVRIRAVIPRGWRRVQNMAVMASWHYLKVFICSNVDISWFEENLSWVLLLYSISFDLVRNFLEMFKLFPAVT